MAWRSDRSLNRPLLLGFLGGLTLLVLLPGWVGAQSDPPVPSSVPGDLDSDCDVDRLDLNILLAARNTPAAGDDDPRDLDGDGMITVLDARKLVLLCTQPRCAILQSSCDPTNEPPTADAGPDQTHTLAFGQTTKRVSLNGQGSTDPDGQITAYSWAGSPDPADEPQPSVSLSAGTYVFSLLVTDDLGRQSDPDTVTIEILQLPDVHPPQVLLEQTEYNVDEGSTLSFPVSAADPDDENVSIAASPMIPNTDFAATTGADPTGMFAFEPDHSQQGIYTVAFKARDAVGLTDTKTVRITVNNVNRAPTLSVPGDVTVDEGELATVQVVAVDPDGDPVTLNAEPLPDNALFLPSTGAVVFAPDYEQAGTYQIVCTASDGDMEASESLRSTSNEVLKQGARVKSIPSRTMKAGSPPLEQSS